MSLNAPIDGYLPSPLAQEHGLWTSAYHLIHPRSSFRASLSEQIASVEEGPDPVYIWRTGEAPELWSAGAHPGLGINYMSDCVGDLGCWSVCQECQDLDDPEIWKEGTCSPDEMAEYHPSIVTKRASCSTFGFEHQREIYWNRVASKLIRGRERELECRLAEGDCVVDQDGNPTNPFFAQPADADSHAFEIIGGGEPMPFDDAIAALDNALAFCSSGEAGMIHAPAAVVSKLACKGCLKHQDVDYGDGMGERSILRTKSRGNIVVSGTGYSGIGPDGVEPEPNQAWVYATSMVYLIWDKIIFTPDEQDYRSFFKDNRVDIVAEQILGAFYQPCCNFAVLADLCACDC